LSLLVARWIQGGRDPTGLLLGSARLPHAIHWPWVVLRPGRAKLPDDGAPHKRTGRQASTRLPSPATD
jgi:hypothetical protein